ncbi:hypothetical protein HHI36_006127 [Cryptolaemus montrouzieri]|uniref:Endonuclease/exonuclease/phosphatase domain-containing protein n=1 Tax=Cryptolaemus montrouzieri TaxID=559131 RepID=A0ABD2NX34_9CUCU
MGEVKSREGFGSYNHTSSSHRIHHLRELTFKSISEHFVLSLIAYDKPELKEEILALYGSPSLNIASFVDGLKAFLNNCIDVFGVSILKGYLNIDLMDLDDLGKEYLNMFSESRYKSAINTPTRVQGNHSSCIDQIFINSNMPEDKFCPIVRRSGLTDHYSVLLGVNLAEKMNIWDQRPLSNYKKLINYPKLENRLGRETWVQVYSCVDPESVANMFFHGENQEKRKAQNGSHG